MLSRILMSATAGDATLVLDLEQDLYLRLLTPGNEALRKLAGQGDRALRAYLARSALNLALDHQRRRKGRPRLVPLEESAEMPTLLDPEMELASAERMAQIMAAARRAVAGSKHADRDLMIFACYYCDGFSAREIAALNLGLASSGVEGVLLRLTNRIRADLVE